MLVVDQRQQAVAELEAQQVHAPARWRSALPGAGAGAASARRLRRARPLRCVVSLPGEPAGAAEQPGRAASACRAAAPAATISAAGHAERLRDRATSWPNSALSAAPSTPALETSRPAAVETISAGICVTRPSPMVSRVKVCAASAKLTALCGHADDDAADDVDDDDQQAGDGVAAHELAAPSMAPKKLLSSSRSLRRARAPGFVDQAGGQIGVDRHLLAGHGVQGEARRDFGDAARALGDDDEVHDHQDREDDDADDEIAAA